MKALIIGLFSLFFVAESKSQKIVPFSTSKSHFKSPPVLKKNNYPTENIFRIYKKGATGLSTISNLKSQLLVQIEEFANTSGKQYDILGSQISDPPYILGNYPRIELVFALSDNIESTSKSGAQVDNKFEKLEKLKKLFDDGVLTKEEFEAEKKKILNPDKP
jgi:hypothetical protein